MRGRRRSRRHSVSAADVETQAGEGPDAVDAPLRVDWRVVAGLWTVLAVFNYSRFALLGAVGVLRKSFGDAWDTLAVSHGAKALLWVALTPLILHWARTHRPGPGSTPPAILAPAVPLGTVGVHTNARSSLFVLGSGSARLVPTTCP